MNTSERGKATGLAAFDILAAMAFIKRLPKQTKISKAEWLAARGTILSYMPQRDGTELPDG